MDVNARDQHFADRFWFLVFIVLLLSVTTGISQIIYPPGQINADIRPGGLVVPINYASKTDNRGEEYVNNEWHQGTIILLTGDSIHHYPLKYNLTTGAIEVKTKDAVKVVPLNEVRRFYWRENGQRSDFINSSGYSMIGTPFVGYLQLLSEGTVNLFKKAQLTVQKANYRPELDVGSSEAKIIREDVYYVARGTDIFELKKKSRNHVYDFFRQHRAKVKKYAQQQGWQPKQEEDLIKIVEYYN